MVEANVSLEAVYKTDVKEDFTIEDARTLTKPTEKLFCTLANNTALRFGEYSIRDPDSGMTVMHISGEDN